MVERGDTEELSRVDPGLPILTRRTIGIDRSVDLWASFGTDIDSIVVAFLVGLFLFGLVSKNKGPDEDWEGDRYKLDTSSAIHSNDHKKRSSTNLPITLECQCRLQHVAEGPRQFNAAFFDGSFGSNTI